MRKLSSFKPYRGLAAVEQKAITRLPIEKGVFTKEQFLERVKIIDKGEKRTYLMILALRATSSSVLYSSMMNRVNVELS